MFPKRTKYGSRRRNLAGRSFASGLEAALYERLLLFEKSGRLINLKCQPHVFLTDARIEMIPDFSAEENGALRYFEAKGFETDTYRIKRKLWTVYGPAPLEVYKGTAKRLYLFETIIPLPKNI